MTESRPPRAREIPCARCGKPTLFTAENPYRPFCSERCKLIDLGNWAEGRYAIPIEGAAGPDEDEANDDQHGRNADPNAGGSGTRGED